MSRMFHINSIQQYHVDVSWTPKHASHGRVGGWVCQCRASQATNRASIIVYCMLFNCSNHVCAAKVRAHSTRITPPGNRSLVAISNLVWWYFDDGHGGCFSLTAVFMHSQSRPNLHLAPALCMFAQFIATPEKSKLLKNHLPSYKFIPICIYRY